MTLEHLNEFDATPSQLAYHDTTACAAAAAAGGGVGCGGGGGDG